MGVHDIITKMLDSIPPDTLGVEKDASSNRLEELVQRELSQLDGKEKTAMSPSEKEKLMKNLENAKSDEKVEEKANKESPDKAPAEEKKEEKSNEEKEKEAYLKSLRIYANMVEHTAAEMFQEKQAQLQAENSELEQLTKEANIQQAEFGAKIAAHAFSLEMTKMAVLDSYGLMDEYLETLQGTPDLMKTAAGISGAVSSLKDRVATILRKMPPEQQAALLGGGGLLGAMGLGYAAGKIL